MMMLLQRLQTLDTRLFHWTFYHSRYLSLSFLARTLSRTGDGYLQVVLPLLILWLDPERGWPLLMLILLAFSIERSCYRWLKQGLKRRRPPNQLPSVVSLVTASDEFSFPSGHTAAAFLLAVLVGHFLPDYSLALWLWASAVGLSRVLVGVHFPGDIVAGALIGSGIGYCCLLLVI
ncbi:phosphatase PAP2 family protein [Aestuariirhabdus sp. Z084]|uniref:phosphatase PAP2 family protein n=1 Tax=Aestuariirhabdus haliotis TaxID=2918751 RepID=UPI00201B3533|nr:phosphatase PAP2 family protein [Aestuariirhabdus haliotis]MCL6415711.1 phosphatase PAP2 family protein [Aestuariirhabdus haliotis]MCL6419763.1 phosphatase PAP2 family protein [Aestuariirhabdus haliotis]